MSIPEDEALTTFIHNYYTKQLLYITPTQHIGIDQLKFGDIVKLRPHHINKYLNGLNIKSGKVSPPKLSPKTIDTLLNDPTKAMNIAQKITTQLTARGFQANVCTEFVQGLDANLLVQADINKVVSISGNVGLQFDANNCQAFQGNISVDVRWNYPETNWFTIFASDEFKALVKREHMNKDHQYGIVTRIVYTKDLIYARGDDNSFVFFAKTKAEAQGLGLKAEAATKFQTKKICDIYNRYDSGIFGYDVQPIPKASLEPSTSWIYKDPVIIDGGISYSVRDLPNMAAKKRALSSRA